MCSYDASYWSASTAVDEPPPTLFRAGATCSPSQRRHRQPAVVREWEVTAKLLDPPGNKPNTSVGEADLISHRSGDVQIASVHVRRTVDHRDIVGTPACVTHRKLGAKRQGAVRRTPRRRRHQLPRGCVGSWY